MSKAQESSDGREGARTKATSSRSERSDAQRRQRHRSTGTLKSRYGRRAAKEGQRDACGGTKSAHA